MTFAHDRHICDNRDYSSSQICDLRDSYFCDLRENLGMDDPQIEIKRWLRAEVDARDHGVRTELAKAVGISPNMVTKILNLESSNPKDRRSIKPHELPKIARFFGKLPPGYEGMTKWLSGDSDAGTPTPDVGLKIIAEFERLDPSAQADVLVRAVEIVARRHRDETS